MSENQPEDNREFEVKPGEVRTLPGLIKSLHGDKIGGFASFLSTDRHRELVLPKAFEKWLPIYMAHAVMLLGHESDSSRELPIGKFHKLIIRDLGLEVEGTLLPEHPKYHAVRAAVEAGLMAWSIGFYPKVGRNATDEEKAAHGMDLEWVWEEIELLEVSLVSIGSNRNTFAALRAIQGREAIRDMSIAEYAMAIRQLIETRKRVEGLTRKMTFSKRDAQQSVDTIMGLCNDFIVNLKNELNALLEYMPDAEGTEEEPETPAEPDGVDSGTEDEKVLNELKACESLAGKVLANGAKRED